MKSTTKWFEVRKDSAKLAFGGQPAVAISLLNNFLRKEISRAHRCEAYGLRATIKEDMGNRIGARYDYQAAHRLSPRFSYLRYTLELMFAGWCERSKQPHRAFEWYRSAVRVCLSTKGVSCGAALAGFLRNQPKRDFARADEHLLGRGVAHSLRTLRVKPKPGFKSWDEACKAISELESTPQNRRLKRREIGE